MVYFWQRIIQNHFQWERPSPGRIGPSGEGDYVKKNGFGHEDWNFNNNYAINGYIHGYCYHRPSPAKEKDTFNIVFATYINRRWFIAGFYLNAVFEDKPPINKSILIAKMRDLLQLGNSLGKSWRNLNRSGFIKQLSKNAQYLTWKVKTTDAIRTTQPIEVPKSLFNPNNYRITKPTEIDKKRFDAIFRYVIKYNPYTNIEYESEFPEGREVERTHRTRERNSVVVMIAKRNFKIKYGKLFCQVCKFDFESKYGKLGSDFIEAHHTLAVSERRGEFQTKPSDIAMVCPNCHRMLHRRRPWLTMGELTNLIK